MLLPDSVAWLLAWYLFTITENTGVISCIRNLRLFNEFHIGVALFFVLSGFLIAYTYAEEPMRSGKAYVRYMLLRLARIMPLYWLVLTAFYLDPAFGKGQFSALTYSLFHGFSDKHNLVGIAQAWSLNVEMTFYFFAPLLCLLRANIYCTCWVRWYCCLALPGAPVKHGTASMETPIVFSTR